MKQRYFRWLDATFRSHSPDGSTLSQSAPDSPRDSTRRISPHDAATAAELTPRPPTTPALASSRGGGGAALSSRGLTTSAPTTPRGATPGRSPAISPGPAIGPMPEATVGLNSLLSAAYSRLWLPSVPPLADELMASFQESDAVHEVTGDEGRTSLLGGLHSLSAFGSIKALAGGGGDAARAASDQADGEAIAGALPGSAAAKGTAVPPRPPAGPPPSSLPPSSLPPSSLSPSSLQKPPPLQTPPPLRTPPPSSPQRVASLRTERPQSSPQAAASVKSESGMTGRSLRLQTGRSPRPQTAVLRSPRRPMTESSSGYPPPSSAGWHGRRGYGYSEGAFTSDEPPHLEKRPSLSQQLTPRMAIGESLPSDASAGAGRWYVQPTAYEEVTQPAKADALERPTYAEARAELDRNWLAEHEDSSLEMCRAQIKLLQKFGFGDQIRARPGSPEGEKRDLMGEPRAPSKSAQPKRPKRCVTRPRRDPFWLRTVGRALFTPSAFTRFTTPQRLLSRSLSRDMAAPRRRLPRCLRWGIAASRARRAAKQTPPRRGQRRSSSCRRTSRLAASSV